MLSMLTLAEAGHVACYVHTFTQNAAHMSPCLAASGPCLSMLSGAAPGNNGGGGGAAAGDMGSVCVASAVFIPPSSGGVWYSASLSCIDIFLFSGQN